MVGTSLKQAIILGVRRGMLSNESGLGSAAIAQSASKSSDPSRNGLIAMTGTFIDTLVVNTLTTLTIVITGMYLKTAAFGSAEGLTSTALTAAAFNSVIPYLSPISEMCWPLPIWEPARSRLWVIHKQST